MKYQSKYRNEDTEMNPQLPSFVDVVFILLIFFLVMSILGFGLVETGQHSVGVHEKEQDLSEFPDVTKALHKNMQKFIVLALRTTDTNENNFYIYSSLPFLGVSIQNAEEYEIIHSRIREEGFTFNNSNASASLRILQANWGPFESAEAMYQSNLVQNSEIGNLIIQANKEFTYHDILSVMRIFKRYQSIHFEVIENEKI